MNAEPGTSCPLCGRGAVQAMFPDAHPWLARCDGCGLGLATPQPTDAELAAIYDAEYYDQFGYREGGDRGLAATKRATYDRLLRRVERFVLPGRLIDVGCGLGYSLSAADGRGWQATGLEPHAKAGAGDSADGRVLRGTLEGFAPPQRFDLVSLIDVIEHVRDPLTTIAQAASLLADGGVLLLTTPDLASRPARRLGPRWVHFHRAHLWYFNRATLGEAVRRAGLRVRLAGTAPRVYNLDYVCGILARSDNFPLARSMARLALKATPGPLRRMSWPPLPEGLMVIASREAGIGGQGPGIGGRSD
ncbi:MAG: hypothetical protein BIFFINMI_01176 [Phycisphaerae bacterium]|nr:hypothetical protein [Phycisphaerae bacterium]